jgi:hypothetical protein
MISYTNIQLILLYTKNFYYICADNNPHAVLAEAKATFMASQSLDHAAR